MVAFRSDSGGQRCPNCNSFTIDLPQIHRSIFIVQCICSKSMVVWTPLVVVATVFNKTKVWSRKSTFFKFNKNDPNWVIKYFLLVRDKTSTKKYPIFGIYFAKKPYVFHAFNLIGRQQKIENQHCNRKQPRIEYNHFYHQHNCPICLGRL